VLHRLGEDAVNTLREQQISGDLQQWNALIVELGGSPHPTSPTPATPAHGSPPANAVASAALPNTPAAQAEDPDTV
jgi:hypothetical protein